MTINSINFAGKYSLDANQQLNSIRESVKRDNLVSYWCDYATNGFTMAKDFEKQMKSSREGEYKMEFEIPDMYNSYFEDCFNSVGQKFDKIG